MKPNDLTLRSEASRRVRSRGNSAFGECYPAAAAFKSAPASARRIRSAVSFKP
jgi:hypothetical protein